MGFCKTCVHVLHQGPCTEACGPKRLFCPSPWVADASRIASFLQLIAWSRMDQKLQVKLPEGADRASDATPTNSRPSSAASSKSGRAALTWVYPHMHAVELRKPACVSAIIASAGACFRFDAEGKRGATITQGYHLASREVEFSDKVTNAAAKKMVEWINIQIGASNPPTALFRWAPVTHFQRALLSSQVLCMLASFTAPTDWQTCLIHAGWPFCHLFGNLSSVHTCD